MFPAPLQLRRAFVYALPCALLISGCARSASPAPEQRVREGAQGEPRAQASTPAAAAPAAPPDLTAPPPDAQKTASGLVTKVLQPGQGERTPQPNDRVRVHFSGWKASGKPIASTREGEPATFALGAVIPGWAEGLQLMRVGERRRLWIPDQLGYYRPGRDGSTVVFDIELLEILEGEAPPAPQDVAAPPADATRTDSGLAYRLMGPAKAEGGEAARPRAWDRVTLRYAGWTPDGALFEDAARARFDVDAVMPGWREALQLMTVGQRARLWIPEALAYRGRSGPPKGMVVFDLELLAVERRPEPPRAPADVAGPPSGAKRTDSGLAYRMLAKGEGGARPTAGSRVKLAYSGWTTNGALIESSTTTGKPRTVPLARVMEGWREGLQLMSVGDRARFWIPEQLAYRGAPGAPKGTLVYELELLEVID